MQTHRTSGSIAAIVGILSFTSLRPMAPMTLAQTLDTAPTHKQVFNNGLTLLVREDNSAPVVSVQAWVKAGSISEGEWMGAGLSHVLEHMLFKGTKTRGVAQIAQEIEAKGGYINAYTSFEQTVYYVNMPSENWQTALDILADCMMNATIPEDELLKEKKVIHREMSMNDDNPDRRASRMLWSTAYTTHPYQHPVIGYPDIYNRTTRADVVAYYQRHYVPNNMMFVVAGNVKAADVADRLKELTKDFKRAAINPIYIPAEPPQLSTRVRHEEMDTELTRLYLSWHIPAVTHPDVYPLDVLAIALGQGRSSRLYRELQQKRGLVHSIDAGSYTPGHPGLFIVSASTDPDKRDITIQAIREQIANLATQPVSESELQKAIKSSISQHIDRLKTVEGQASDIGHNDLLVGDPDFSSVYLENLRRVTVADLKRVLSTYFTDANLTITSLNPTGAIKPTTTATSEAGQIAIQKFELPNGLRLLVREDPKLPYVDVRALFKGGVLAETPANNGITKLMSRTLLKGTTTRTADQIAESIESVGGGISYFSGNNSFGISSYGLSDDLDLALQLVADVLQHPSFPQDLLDRERDVQLAEIKSEQDQIMRVAQHALREAMYQSHPYRLNSLGTAPSVTNITRDNLLEFHRQYIVPNNMVLTVFGNVKADDIRAKVQKLFGPMKSAKLNFPNNGPERLSTSTTKKVLQPREQAVVLLGFSGTDIFSPDRFALELLSEAYSGQGSRLFLRIRDELGLAYYVGAYELVGLDPGYFVLYIGTTTDKAGTCETEFRAELAKVQTDGLTQDELDRARAGLIGQRKVRMQDNSDLSMAIGLDELYGLGHEYFRTLDDHYRAVTVDDIKRVAKKYFADKPHVVVVAGPEQSK